MWKQISLFLILLLSTACKQQPTAVTPPTTPTITITEADKIQIIKTATRWAINHLLSSQDLLQSANNIYLITENLPPAWIPTFTQYPVIPITPTEIQQIAKDNQHILMYLSFTEIQFGPDGIAQITISSIPAAPDGGGAELGGEAKLQFEQTNGEWILTVLWIAVS
ncbi:MAG: hypothetical protein H6658_19320 [Ardenticatenaceae bacterium]|nr:hypothetical protein [Ardenticatenaceae bacterium]